MRIDIQQKREMEQRVLSDIVKHMEAEKWKLASFINAQHITMLSVIAKAVEEPEFDQKKGKFVEILLETIDKMKKQGDGLKWLVEASSASSSPQDPR